MSSDNFDVEIRSIEGDTVELLCITGTAGGLNDYAMTRSFALSVLDDALREGKPKKKKAPLRQALEELGGDTPPVWEESFHEAHVGKFIDSTEIVERIGIIKNEQAWGEKRRAARDALEGKGRRVKGDIELLLDEQCPRHRFVLRVKVTDPRWLTGVTPGQRFGTTSFDAWWDDPKRPKPWKPAKAKRTSAKKVTAKKVTVKKVTAKKATAKKRTNSA